MRRWILIIGVFIAAFFALTYVQWRLRAVAAVDQILAPQSLTGLEFSSTLGDGKWVPVATEDAAKMVESFNENRRALARMTTPVFSPRGSWAIALAPFARLRCDGIVEDWHVRTNDDALVERYLARSLDR